jgi:hypothetical protein
VLYDGRIEDADKTDKTEAFFAERAAEELWREHHEAVLTDWVGRFPGTRPSLWWRFDAPRMPEGAFPGCYYDGTLPEPRQRLGGVGTPAFEALANVPRFAFGLPVDWVTEFDVAYYNGRSVDADGNQLTRQDGATPYREGDFTGLAPSESFPPVFESQAAYLRRHNLLLLTEQSRLRPADFKPEMLRRIADDGVLLPPVA